jgi:hypothetical protein
LLAVVAAPADTVEEVVPVDIELLPVILFPHHKPSQLQLEVVEVAETRKPVVVVEPRMDQRAQIHLFQ